MKKIVICGAGIAGIKVYKELHSKLCGKRGCEARIFLVNRTNYFTFVPMLHEAATGGVDESHVVTPLREIASCHNHEVYVREVTGIDIEKSVVLAKGGEIPFDYLVIALGSTTNFFGVPGAKEYSLGVRTLEDARRLRAHLNALFEEASEAEKREQEKLMHIVIMGGGAVGVELAGQVATLLRDVCRLYPRIKRDTFRVTLVHGGDRLIPNLDAKLSRWALRALERLGVAVVFNRKVVEVRENAVVLDDGSILKTCSNIWTAGAIPNTHGVVPRELLDEKGFVAVDQTLSSAHHRHIFAAGDAARMYNLGVPVSAPMLAEAAYDGAQVVAENIVRALRGNEDYKLFNFHSKGSLVPIGDWYALAQVFGGIKFKGRLTWWLRRTLYLWFIYDWRDRVRIVLDWTLDIFGVRDTTKY